MAYFMVKSNFVSKYKNEIVIGYSMICFGYGIYTRSGAPECIFHNQHKALLMNSLVSVFCSRHFSVIQLKFEIHIILCQFFITVLFRVLKIKTKFVEINISDCSFLSSSYGSEPKKGVGCGK